MSTKPLLQRDMRTLEIEGEFDLAYCLSSSIQYNLDENDLKEVLEKAINGEFHIKVKEMKD